MNKVVAFSPLMPFHRRDFATLHDTAGVAGTLAERISRGGSLYLKSYTTEPAAWLQQVQQSQLLQLPSCNSCNRASCCSCCMLAAARILTYADVC